MSDAAGIDLARAEALFEDGADFTCGLEEEFALIDPGSGNLVQRFEDLWEASRQDPILSTSAAGELISSEIEIRSGPGRDFLDAAARQRAARARLFSLAQEQGVGLAAIGAHPFAAWQDQRIIDTPHYRRVSDDLQYVAWRNNTFSLHVHVGVRGADRAVAVCDVLRTRLPEFLALSANSTYIDGRFAGLHSVRSQIFTKSFPRCGIPEPFVSWRSYIDHVEFLMKSGSVVEHTQLWWSIRPHLGFGTVEVRICDAQSRGDESLAVAALVYASVVQAAADYDAGARPEALPARLIEENFWRAIRYGLGGRLIDIPRSATRTARAAVLDLVEWTAPAREALGLDRHLPALERMIDRGNGAERQHRSNRRGATPNDALAAAAEETKSYVEGHKQEVLS